MRNTPRDKYLEGERGRATRLAWTSALLFAVLASALVLTAAKIRQHTPGPDLLKAADEVLRKVVELRGLEQKGKVAKGIKSREEIARYLEHRVKDEYDAGELEREGKLLKKLGLIPGAMDYRDFTLKLLTEQVGGYYDPEKKTFFIAGWLPLEQQKPVMAHELAHALQDQHFDVRRFLKRDRNLQNDDAVLAQQALLEGDGMAVMLDFVLEPLGRNFTQLPGLVGFMRSQLSPMDSQFALFNQAPVYLRESLLFPYIYGVAFLQKVRERGSWAEVDRVYSDLPASTEQIIHPEKYLERRDRPQAVELDDPSPKLGPGWRSEYRNVLGEFALYLLLKLELPDDRALAASSGWGGDRVLLAEKQGSNASAVFAETVWDSSDDASEFYEALASWFQARFPEAKREGSRESGLAWVDGGDYHVSALAGTRVRFALGLPTERRGSLKGYWP